MQLSSLTGESKKMLVTRYTNINEPAFSPLAFSKKYDLQKVLKADSVFEINSQTPFTLTTAGTYFFRAGNDTTDGITIFVADKRFPRFTQAKDLLKPVIYISSNDEIREANTAKEPKRTLDRYWLRLAGGNEDAAKRNVKLYYRRVTQANLLFTTYKEGWKTDLGMVFIVFGPPDKINRLKDRQIWTYKDVPNFQEVNFTFVKRPNQLAENNYELLRYAEYDQAWTPLVEAWRNGGN
ncbi:MAG: GWxTD domain-containing protein [Verrucomicrobia bacterium]|nr:GWxTD domain-containing protein [Cytophagales bacterium]